MDYSKYIGPNSHDEQFTVNLKDGSGYEVYYREKNGYWWYTVTYNGSGCRMYSKTHRLPREMYEQIKAQNT